VEASYRLAVARIQNNAYRIQRFEFPFYEELVNLRSKRYQLTLDMYVELQRTTSLARDSEYCLWKKLVDSSDSGEPCGCKPVRPVGRLKFEGCDLAPITPHIYHR